MDTAVLVGVISASAAIVVPAVSFYLAKRKDQEADWRKYKFEQYRDFLVALSGIVGTDATPENQRRFALASNTLNWQWAAGCGADAAPYFRIFNPVLQAQRYDPGGEYLRRWIAPLAGLPDPEVHTPWLAAVPPPAYPAPMVDLKTSRQAALDAYQTMRSGSLSAPAH